VFNCENSNCRYYSDTASANVVSTDVFLKLSRKKVRLLFEMLPSFKANKFVEEVGKATEG
jgi:hypothetical protein